jgi:hypothetical protein
VIPIQKHIAVRTLQLLRCELALHIDINQKSQFPTVYIPQGDVAGLKRPALAQTHLKVVAFQNQWP